MYQLIFFALIFLNVSVFAEEDCTSHCASNILRVDVAPNVLTPSNAQTVLPSLKRMTESFAFQNSLQKNEHLSSIGFPQNAEACEREQQQGNSDYAKIDCRKPFLCSDEKLNPSVRSKICFKIPCETIEGPLNESKCEKVEDIYPVGISFPGSLKISKVKLQPTSVDFKDNKTKICFKLNELALSMNAALALDIKGTSLPDKSIEISNINTVLDKPKDICLTADLKIGSQTPVSNVQISTLGSEPFVSDDMLRSVARHMRITGLSGYAADDLNKIQAQVVPVLLQPIRSSVEEAIKKSLGDELEKELKRYIPSTAGTQTIDSKFIMSELGINNALAQKPLANFECVLYKANSRDIPDNHPCLASGKDYNTLDAFSDAPENNLPYLADVTSESIKQRLINLKPLAAEVDDKYTGKEVFHPQMLKKLETAINEISNKQMEDKMLSVIAIQNKVTSGMTNSILMSLPEICSPKPSPYEGRKIANCPIQVYGDLLEFNQLLKKMWESGRMCLSGKGPYVPRKDAKGNPLYYKDKFQPLTDGGCYMNFQGMSCYLGEPPKITFDSKTKKYKTKMALKGCYRHGDLLLMGFDRLGGDFNIDFSFSPKACGNGDFCADKPNLNWSMVPGTGRWNLDSQSMLQTITKQKINEAVSEGLANTIRLPLGASQGPLAGIPLQAEGRVDSGPGFFGLCLKLPAGAKAE